MEEIMSAVKKFLIAEGLLTGDSSLATARPTRRLLGENVSHMLLSYANVIVKASCFWVNLFRVFPNVAFFLRQCFTFICEIRNEDGET